MSFEAGCRHHMVVSWRTAVTLYPRLRGVQRTANRKDSAATRAGMGCLGFVLIGWLWFLLPALFVAAICAVVAAYATVVTAVWALAAIVALGTGTGRAVTTPPPPPAVDAKTELGGWAAETPVPSHPEQENSIS
ncbi:MAG: hypothetical protein ACYCUG_06125 [Acidimicrobiales bacterium]